MRLKFIAPTLASAALLGTALTSGVATASAPAAAHGAAVAKAAPTTCVRVIAAEALKIRKTKSVNATALGVLPKNAEPCTTGHLSEKGGKYSLCGFKNADDWQEITYRGIRGWIPYYCTKGM